MTQPIFNEPESAASLSGPVFALPRGLGGTGDVLVPCLAGDALSFGGASLPPQTIYLDAASATPVDLRVLTRMLPWMTGLFANPANRLHPMGELAEYAVAEARERVATAVGARADEVIFVASATEANNLVLRGLVESPFRKRHRLAVLATEHSSVLATAQALADRPVAERDGAGVRLDVIPVDRNGQADLDVARAVLSQDTICLCAMDVNNETGVRQTRMPDLLALARAHGIPVHVDAVQGFARGGFSAAAVDCDTFVVSGAKIYGPKGAAALIVRKRRPRLRLEPQLTGGGQENGLRSSTLNVPAIIGLSHACAFQAAEARQRAEAMRTLEQRFLEALSARAGEVVAIGPTELRAGGIVTVCLPGVNAMKLLERARLVCASVGSACRTLQATASPVLLAMGVELGAALSSFRVSFGLYNSVTDVERAAELLARAAAEVRRGDV